MRPRPERRRESDSWSMKNSSMLMIRETAEAIDIERLVLPTKRREVEVRMITQILHLRVHTRTEVATEVVTEDRARETQEAM